MSAAQLPLSNLAKIIAFLSSQGKGLSLLLVLILGALFPPLHVLSFLIQYLLMGMLFLSFVGIELKPGGFQKSMVWIQLTNIGLPFLCYGLLAPWNRVLALAAFMTAIAPTAIAAPVLAGFIQGQVEFVMATLLLTTVSSAVVIPLALPSLLGAEVQITVWQVLQPVMVILFLPLILAYGVSRLPRKVQAGFHKAKALSFPIWLINLVLISANASNFLLNESPDSVIYLGVIAFISLVICLFNYCFGAWLGRPHYSQEASISLGQKNLSFVIWVTLAFINPLVAMGPTFYILYHHLVNSWMIYQFEKRRAASPMAVPGPTLPGQDSPWTS